MEKVTNTDPSGLSGASFDEISWLNGYIGQEVTLTLGKMPHPDPTARAQGAIVTMSDKGTLIGVSARGIAFRSRAAKGPAFRRWETFEDLYFEGAVELVPAGRVRIDR